MEEIKKTYELNSGPNSTGEIYYEDASGNRRYYQSNSYDSYENVESQKIYPQKIFETNRWHLAPNIDRSRNNKDKIATFFSSNLIPQQFENNRIIWQQPERHVREVSIASGNSYVDTYVIAGGDGSDKDGTVRKNLTSPLIAEELAFTHEVNFTKKGIIEFGIGRSAADEAGLPQISLTPDSIVKIAANEGASYAIVNPSEVGTTEINIFPSNNVPNSISKISFPQNRATEVNSEGGTLQINTAEVNTSKQPFTRVSDAKIGEISLPSSISNQQFLNNNFLSIDIHSSTPNLDQI